MEAATVRERFLLPNRLPQGLYVASARSCSASGAVISSAAMTAANPAFDFLPRES